MARSVHFVRLGLTAALLAASVRGQVAPATPTVPATPAPAGTEPPASPKLTKLFAGNPPKFDPPKSEPATPATTTTTADQPRNGIVRLPTYIVRSEARLPDEYQILTPQGRDAAMAQRYMGPQNTLDGVLNAFTLAGAWKSIPLLGKIPFVPFDSKNYNERAASIYEKPEQKRRFGELWNIEETARQLEPSPPADKPAK